MASSTDSPVDDATYNLMQALVSKLETIEAYSLYAEDEGGELFTELLVNERTHADRPLEQLRERLAS
jgi:hypothetical protein